MLLLMLLLLLMRVLLPCCHSLLQSASGHLVSHLANHSHSGAIDPSDDAEHDWD